MNELTSTLRSDTKQVTVSLTGFGFRGTTFNTGYTWSRSRDQSYGFGEGGFGGTTAGDPNVSEWGRSDLDRRHNFIGTVTWPVRQSLELTAVGRMTSGGPYTPLVSGAERSMLELVAALHEPAVEVDVAIP